MYENKVRAGYKRVRFDFDQFDRLTRQQKEVCWYSFASIIFTKGPGPVRPETLAQLRIKEAQACEATYGPEHPQSYTSKFGKRKVVLAGADLGF